jgi:hypothetical protein
MVVLYRREAESHTGELQIGWPSWDEKGEHGKLSVRFAYKRSDGKFSRTSPEMPLKILYEMVGFLGDSLNDMLGKVRPTTDLKKKGR